MNKSASALLLMVCLVTVGGGSASKLSVRGGHCGGVLLGVDFVLGPRRRGDAGSGVVARSWSLYRSGWWCSSVHRRLRAGMRDGGGRICAAWQIRGLASTGVVPADAAELLPCLADRGELLLQLSKLCARVRRRASASWKVFVPFSGGALASTVTGEGRRWCCVQVPQGSSCVFRLFGVVCAFVLDTCVFRSVLEGVTCFVSLSFIY